MIKKLKTKAKRSCIFLIIFSVIYAAIDGDYSIELLRLAGIAGLIWFITDIGD